MDSKLLSKRVSADPDKCYENILRQIAFKGNPPFANFRTICSILSGALPYVDGIAYKNDQFQSVFTNTGVDTKFEKPDFAVMDDQYNELIDGQDVDWDSRTGCLTRENFEKSEDDQNWYLGSKKADFLVISPTFNKFLKDNNMEDNFCSRQMWYEGIVPYVSRIRYSGPVTYMILLLDENSEDAVCDLHNVAYKNAKRLWVRFGDNETSVWVDVPYEPGEDK